MMFILQMQSLKCQIKINYLREILKILGYAVSNVASYVVSFHHSEDIPLTQLHGT